MMKYIINFIILFITIISSDAAYPQNSEDRCGIEFGGRKCDPGECCSKYYYCGTSEEHCSLSEGCQPDFGICNGKNLVLESITGKVHWAGFRYSYYGLNESFGKNNIPNSNDLIKYTENFKNRFGNNPKGTFILIVGTNEDIEYCHFNFPEPNDIQYSSPLKVRFDNEDSYEEFLTKCDEKDYDVWLQVEPGFNDLVDLANIVLNRYGHHKSVKGYGIDLEWWYRYNEYGSKLDDKTAEKVVIEVQKRNPNYTVFVKHWKSSFMPKNYRKGMIFIDDSNNLSISDMKEEFIEWSIIFKESPVMFQIGYNEDHSLWKDNPIKFANEIANEVSKYNEQVGIIWVDFSMKELIEKEKL